VGVGVVMLRRELILLDLLLLDLLLLLHQLFFKV